MTLTTLAGSAIEAQGRAVTGRAVLRLKDLSGVKRELLELAGRHEALLTEVASLRALIERLPSPVWMRDAAGRLAFVNAAYAQAVEARNAVDAVERSLELLDSAARENIARSRAAGGAYAGRLPAIVAGTRRSFDVLDFRTETGSAGLGIDATEAETMRGALARMVDAHRRTLDQLSTGVAMFDTDHKLSFYNAAYRALWDLDAGYLDQAPTDSAVLERLRAARKLPEEQDFRQWKAELQEAYRAIEPKEHAWHLPDGRTLRVVTTPNPDGGVTYLFDDVTERLDLERRFDALIRVQGETLDNLTEGVAVFASDGRLRLFNPAFARMWRLPPPVAGRAAAHRDGHRLYAGRCTAMTPTWQALRAVVTAIDSREAISGRLDARDGSVVDCPTVPLPDGATLVTFHDVTDSVNVERALRERNEALVDADRIKIDFVHHVSYELRSPLTNIIGFAHLLGDPATGPLAPKQREYLGYITVSTNTLLAIINNILDLATIDAGAHAAQPRAGRHPRHHECGRRGRSGPPGQAPALRSTCERRADIGSFIADERRMRQVLFNLLANAVGFSPAGSDRHVAGRAAGRCRGVLGHRPRAGYSARDAGEGVRLVRDAFARFAPSRHRDRPFAGALVRRAARRYGDDHLRRRAKAPTVTCTFPLGAAARRADAARRIAEPTSCSIRPPRRRKLHGDAAQRAGDGALRHGHRRCARARRPRDALRRSRRRQDRRSPARSSATSPATAAIEVPSPSFTLVQTYELPRFALVHADLYRLTGSAELAELGFDDLPEGAVVLMEWPDRAGDSCRPTGSTLPSRWRRSSAPTSAMSASSAMAASPSARSASARCAPFSTKGASATRIASACRAMRRPAPSSGWLEGQTHDPDEFAAAARRPAGRAASPTARSPISPRMSCRSSPSRRRCASAAFGAKDPPPISTRGLRHDGGSRRRAPWSAAIRRRRSRSATRPRVDVLVSLHRPATAGRCCPSRRELDYRLPPYDMDAFLIEAELLLDWYLPQRGVAVDRPAREDFRRAMARSAAACDRGAADLGAARLSLAQSAVASPARRQCPHRPRLISRTR